MKKNRNVLQWGSQGETLVFLHYFGGAAQSWQWVAEKLAQEYRCIAINLPGFGGAPALEEISIAGFAEYVQQEIDQLKLNSYTLVGHSMGGKIALQVAANAAKGTVRQLILLAPSPPTTEPMPTEERERMLRHPDRQEAITSVMNAIRRDLPAAQQQLAVETQLIVHEAAWQWWLLEGMDYSIADRVQSLEIPLTVLASEDDPVITADVIQERVLAVLEQATLITTTDVGHLLPLEAPDWAARQIRNIVAEEKNAYS